MLVAFRCTSEDWNIKPSANHLDLGIGRYLCPPARICGRWRDAETLVAALKRAIERSHAALQEEAEARTLQQRYATLTRREREVMERVVTGRLNKQVTGDLNISEITVKAHRGRMMQKMKARSLPDLVRMAARLRLAG